MPPEELEEPLPPELEEEAPLLELLEAPELLLEAPELLLEAPELLLEAPELLLEAPELLLEPPELLEDASPLELEEDDDDETSKIGQHKFPSGPLAIWKWFGGH